MRRTKAKAIFFAAIIFVLFISGAAILHAEITTDGTMGSSGSLAGPDYSIPSGLGTQKGGNLFHSFGVFDIDVGESATFSGPSSVANIISRVTGGSASSIDGVLRSTINGANFYFFNPSGILFGPDASIDVSGSFHASTADYLTLGNGGRFDASNPSQSILTSAPVEAFGFLDSSPADIGVYGSILEVPDGQTMSIIGGQTTLYYADLIASDGRINIASVNKKGEVSLDNDGISTTRSMTGGDISCTAGSIISVNGQGAGSIYIRGGNLVIDDDSEVLAQVEGNADGGVIDIDLSGDLELYTGGYISVRTFSSGDAASLVIQADDILIDRMDEDEWTGISATVGENALGLGGNVSITATGDLTVQNGGIINVSTYGKGNAGTLFATADNIYIDSQGNAAWTGIAAGVYDAATGSGGNISLVSRGGLEVVNGGKVSTTTSGPGNAGNVSIEAGDILVDGDGLTSIWTGIIAEVNSGAAGDGGDISITSNGLLKLVDGGQISPSTYGTGNAGNLSVDAQEIIIDRQDGVWTGFAGQVGANATGNSGDMTITSQGTLTIMNGGQISTSTYGKGNAGNVTVEAGNITLEGPGGAFTGFDAEVAASATGNGGNLDISTDGKLELLDGGIISVSTKGQGDAGRLTVNAGQVLVDRQNGSNITGFEAEVASTATGDGGDMEIVVTGQLKLANGGTISPSTYGGGDAGTLSLDAGEIVIDRNGGIWTGIVAEVGSSATGSGGDMEIISQGDLNILSGGLVSASTYGSGNAGAFTIQADNILLDGRGGILGTGFGAEVGENASGNGGDMTISAESSLELYDGGVISVSTFGQGNAGSLTINAKDITIDREDNANRVTGFRGAVDYWATGRGGDITINSTGLMQIINGGQISVSTEGIGDAGRLTVNAKNIIIDGQDSAYDTGFEAGVTDWTAAGRGGDVAVTATERLDILNDGLISVSTQGLGDAGGLTVTANEIYVDGHGTYGTGFEALVGSLAEGDGGDVFVTAAESLQFDNGGTINVSTEGVGDAGSLTVSAGEITLDGNEGILTGFQAEVDSLASGSGGGISVTTTGLLHLINGGNISVSTKGEGNAGSLFVNANEIVLDGEGGVWTGFEAEVGSFATGSGGDMTITSATSIDMLNAGRISVSTKGQGNAGSLIVNAKDIYIDTQGGYLSGLTAEIDYGATGRGGDMTVNATQSLEVVNGGVISVSTYGQGDAGRLTVNAKDILIDSQDGFFTGFEAEVGWSGTGDGGDMEINSTGRLQLLNGGVVSVSTFGQGDAGNLNVNAGDILVDAQNSDIYTGFEARVGYGSTGQGGNMSITSTGGLNLMNGGRITAESKSVGVAGSIYLRALSMNLINDASIITETTVADGGSIEIISDELLRLVDSKISTSVADGKGNGGNITIDPTFVVLWDNSEIIANAKKGSGGNVNIVADYFFIDDTSIVEASSELGIDGTITIETPNIDLSSSFASMPEQKEIPVLGSSSCEARTNNTSSSLVIRGRGSLPPDPNGPLFDTMVSDN